MNELTVADLWNFDAPPGQAWKCPACDSWATLGGNAAYHAKVEKHGMPSLGPLPVKAPDPDPRDARVKALAKEVKRLADRLDAYASELWACGTANATARAAERDAETARALLVSLGLKP